MTQVVIMRNVKLQRKRSASSWQTRLKSNVNVCSISTNETYYRVEFKVHITFLLVASRQLPHTIPLPKSHSLSSLHQGSLEENTRNTESMSSTKNSVGYRIDGGKFGPSSS